MASFPLFMDIKNKKCVVVGGGKTAFRKVQKLALFDPALWVISPDISEELYNLPQNTQIKFIKDCYKTNYIENAFLVIAATNDPIVNQSIYSDAKAKNIFVNVVDCPESCSFYFPAVVKRDDLVIGVCSSGAYPALSKEIRNKIDKSLAQDCTDLIIFLKEARNKIMNDITDPKQRKIAIDNFLKLFLEEIDEENDNEKDY